MSRRQHGGRKATARTLSREAIGTAPGAAWWCGVVASHKRRMRYRAQARRERHGGKRLEAQRSRRFLTLVALSFSSGQRPPRAQTAKRLTRSRFAAAAVELTMPGLMAAYKAAGKD